MFILYMLIMSISAFTIQPEEHTGKKGIFHECGSRMVLSGSCQPCRKTLAPTSALSEMLLTVMKCPLSSGFSRRQKLPCLSYRTRKF
uniref:Uncharacterized protein n=1 Tax=Ursus americanus TaxID=9643 RepID=A0A452QAM0_URSAM